jgi:glycosyltransferase involved in cell wall biosynthesis
MPPCDPTISVVIATRDRRAPVRRIAEQVRQQLRECDELIVVDDTTSQHDSYDWLLPWGRLQFSGGRGPARARNLGWRDARGDVIAFADDDVLIDGLWLAAIRAEFADNCALLALEGRTETRRYDPLFEYSVSSRGPRNGLTCNVAYRRSVLEITRGFDEAFPFPHCEDLDLFTRVMHVGPVKYSHLVRVEHEPRSIAPAAFAKRGGWLGCERILYEKHPELKPYPLSPSLCALIVYLRWPLNTYLGKEARHQGWSVSRLRRTLTITLLWWWNVVKAIPEITPAAS